MEMIRRLGRHEKRLVRTQYGDNILFKAINVPAKGLEREMNGLRLSSEEVFLECLTILDDIKECNTGKEAEQVVDGLYNTLYCDLREISPHNPSENELEIAVGEIVNCVTLILGYYPGLKYSGTLLCLSAQLETNNLVQLKNKGLFYNQFVLHGEEISDYIKSYMDGDDYLSDVIKKQLKKVVPDDSVFVGDGEEKDSEVQLDNRQLVLLFMELLNIPLGAEFTNQSALAELISKVSGKSKKSLLNSIREGVDYENNKTKKDAELIASLLSELKPDLAQQIRNNIPSD